MEGNMNEAMQYFDLANKNRELYYSVAGDFLNSEELNDQIGNAIKFIQQSNGLGELPDDFKLPAEQANYDEAVPQVIAGADVKSLTGREADKSTKLMQHDMPNKEVLIEPCTIHQPSTEFLRKSYSRGTYYFIK